MAAINIAFWGVFAIYIIIGIVVTRFIKDAEDFYVMKHNASTILIWGSLGATTFSAVHLLATGGVIYSVGLPTLEIVYLPVFVGLAFSMLYVGRKMRQMKLYTMADYVGMRFQTESVRTVFTIIMIVGLFGYGAVQLISAGLILAKVTGASYVTVLIAFAVSLFIFCALGGMWGVVATDTLMFITMLFMALVLFPMFLAKVGWWTPAIVDIPARLPDYWSRGGTAHFPMGWTIGQSVMWVFFFGSAPWLVTRAFPAKNDLTLMKAVPLALVAGVIFTYIPHTSLAVLQGVQPGIKPPETAVLELFRNYLPSGWAGLGLAGIAAAMLSTVSAIFLVLGFGLSRDLYQRLFAKGLNEKQQLTVGRIGQVLGLIILVVISLQKPSGLYWIAAWSGSLFAVGWFPVLVASFIWRRVTRSGAISGMLGGSLSFITLYQLANVSKVIVLPGRFDPILWGVLISTLFVVIVSLLTQPHSSDIEFFDKMSAKKPAEEEIEQRIKSEGIEAVKNDYKKTMYIAFGTIIAYIVVLGYFLKSVAFKLP